MNKMMDMVEERANTSDNSGEETAVSLPKRSFNGENLAVILLVLILALAALFRFTGLDWDEAYHLHPDERFLTDTSSLLRPVDTPLDYLRSATSTLNPYNVGKTFYVYGNFPMTVTRYVGEWVNDACASFDLACSYVYNSYNGIHIVGRVLSGLLDLVAVAFIFLIGHRLYDWRVGLLAALLHALAVMPIQQSHFYTMDNWASGLTVVALYTAVRAAGFTKPNQPDQGTNPNYLWYILFGIALGLTMASRINVAPLGFTIGLAGLIWLAQRGYSLAEWLRLWRWSPGQTLDFQRVMLAGMCAIIFTLLTFRLAQPYAFTDAELARQVVLRDTGREPGMLETFARSLVGLNPQFLANMEEIQRLQAPEASFPPALQWVNRAPILFPLHNMVLYGMGITAAIAAWLGTLWSLWRIARFRPDWMAHLIPVSWTLFYFLFMGTRWVKSIRYFLPIYPTLFLLGGWAVFALWQRWHGPETRSQGGKVTGNSQITPAPGHPVNQSPSHPVILAFLILLVVLPSFLWSSAFVQIYRNPVTRVAASDWIFANVPSGATLLYETDAGSKELQLPLKFFEFYVDGIPLTLGFTMPEDGTVTAVRFNYLSSSQSPEMSSANQLRLRLNDGPPTEIALNLDANRQAVTIPLAASPLPEGSFQQLTAELVSGGPMRANTSILMNEHWDDLLPISTQGRNAYGSYYTEVSGGQRPVTHQDNEEKRREVQQWLDEADYLMISSQRAMWHLPRLPLMYPMMVQYYTWLFDGSLGFELVGQFHATHQIGSLYFSDTAARLSWGEPPEIGWPPPAELAAEEAFSVYDHPPVWIFQKTAAYSRENTARLLGSIDLSNPIFMNPLQATQAPNGLMLTAAQWEAQRAGGTFRDIFSIDGVLNQNPWLAAIVWWLAVIVLGWLAFPVTFVVLRGLPDRGYALARIFALLFISYFGWILASYGILPNTRGTLLLGTAVLTLLSLFIILRQRQAMAAWLHGNLATVGVIEVVGVALFLLMIAIRLGNPDVWDIIWGGEKPMDLSYFTAVLKSTTFPPYDPWHAGGFINYYYYGFVYVGSLTKLLGIVPPLAYNLILPMLFSFTGLGVFSVAYNLVANKGTGWQGDKVTNTSPSHPVTTLPLQKQAVIAGLIATALAVLLGNLAQVGVLLNAWQRAGSPSLGEIPLVGYLLQTMDGAIRVIGGQPAPIYTGDWFWIASRAINANPGEVQPITEFPFFTFLYGDLHAHMIALPLTLLALGWAVGLALEWSRGARKQESREAREQGGKRDSPPHPGTPALLQLLFGGLVIGSLRATNTWDWPTYLVIGGLALAFWVWQRASLSNLQSPLSNPQSLLATTLQAILLAALLFGISVITFWPFAANYGTAYNSVSLWQGSYTHLSRYLTIYGLFLLFALSHLAREFRDWTRGWTYEKLRRMEPYGLPLIGGLLVFVALLAFLALRGYWIAPVVLTLIVISGLLGLRPNLPAARRVILILIAAALGLTLAVEIVVLDGDIGRMNTVFKFYMQVWIMLSVVGGVTAVWLWPFLQRSSKFTRRTWQTILGLLLFAALLYPLTATPAKWAIRMSKEAPNTLDGMAFMQYVSYGDTNNSTIPLGYDYEAIHWMWRHVNGSPVIVEGHSHNNGGFSEYRSITSRVAMYTGLPTVIGWDWHQRQQRATTPGWLVSNRVREVNQFYNTTNVQEALNFLHKYEVEYIYAGQLEWVYYSPQGMNKFDQMVQAGYLEEVYRNAGTSIYRVKREA